MRRLSMSRSCVLSLALLGVMLLSWVPGGTPAHADGGPRDVYTLRLSADPESTSWLAGLDVVRTRRDGRLVELDVVPSPAERARLEARGVRVTLWRNSDGMSVRQMHEAQQRGGFSVWRSWDEKGGLRDELQALADAHPELVELRTLGKSLQGREIIAVKVTKDAGRLEAGSRPAVLFTSLQHAREWISVEVNRRLMHYLVDSYETDQAVRELLDSTEVWFVPVCNPDGYQFTFDQERMWRKNLRDNNGDGMITDADGVDPNRNFDAHWRWDAEGSSGDPRSETYRGPEAASEPETQAMQDFLDEMRFAFHVNYHSVGRLILYPPGWQEQTSAADDPIVQALAGTLEQPAIAGFRPVRSADYYITNGETCDYSSSVGTICYTPELSDGGSGGGFVFPDDEELVQAEFELVLPFSLDVAMSTVDPAHPVSHVGSTVDPMYVSAFPLSYGDPQPVVVDAARYLGPVTLEYRIGDGPLRRAPTWQLPAGLRYDAPGAHYAKMVGLVEGARVGDEVTVWFEAGSVRSEDFSYKLVSDTDAAVLVLAAEDYTGSSPTYQGARGPKYVDAYLEALAENGVAADVYDIDAHGRMAPDPVGVLGHYDAVVWYTGDDIVTRETGMAPGSASRLANDTMLSVRDYLNRGGKVLYAGKYAAYQYASQSYRFDPRDDAPCGLAGSDSHCRVLSDDSLRYYFGVSRYERNIETPVDQDNLAGDGTGWWSGSAGDLDSTAARAFDLSAANDDIAFSFDAVWNAEVGYDYGSFEASVDGGRTWQALPDLDGHATDENPHGNNPGWGLTGHGAARLRFDLSTYRGQDSVLLRLRYLTDRFVNYHGFNVDNIQLADAGGVLYENDLETDFSDWTLDGWIAVPADPPQGPAVYPVRGLVAPFEGLSWDFDTSAESNVDHSGAGVPTSLVLPVEEFPQFESWNAAWYVKPEALSCSDDPASPPDFECDDITDQPAGAVVVTPNTIFFGFGLEGVASTQDRAAIMDRVLQHFGIETAPEPTPSPSPTPATPATPSPQPTAPQPAAEIFLPQLHNRY